MPDTTPYFRTFASYVPLAEGEDFLRENSLALSDIVGSGDRTIFRSLGNMEITQIAILVESSVTTDGGNYWKFNVANAKTGQNLLSEDVTLQNIGNGLVAGVPFLLYPDQNLLVGEGDVLVLQARKVGSAALIPKPLLITDYKILGFSTTTSTSSTTTTSTTTQTTSTSSTSTTSSSTSTTTTITFSSSSSTTTSTTTTSSSTTVT